MNLSDPDQLKSFLHHSGFKPRDYMGQNFLVDEVALAEIIQAADLKSSDTVLEVGPGLGVLTLELAKKAGQVIAVEKDDRLFSMLSKSSREVRNIKMINADILKFNLKDIPKKYKVVANIPYYLTSKLFQIFLEVENKPELIVLMIQKEVGERVVALPGELSILGISVQIYADAEIVMEVPKESFWPQPEVDSVILKITPKEKYPEIQDKKLFFRILKMAFAGKRKQIQNSLANGMQKPKEEILSLLKSADIDSTTRPQDLAVEDWIRLYKLVSAQ